jgi:hypothetical protein
VFEDIFMRTAGNKKKPGDSQPHGAMADDHLRPDHPRPVGCVVQGENESIEIEMSIKYMYKNASKYPVKPKAQVLLYEQ